MLAATFPLFAVIVAATESLQPDDTILGASLLGGAVVAQLLAAVLGALVITGEFKTGMIRTTLTACPRRLVVLAAKATVVGGVVFAVTLPSAASAFGVGALMLDGDRYTTGEAFPALLGVVLAITAISVFGVGVGTLVRHSAGAVAAAVAVVLVPGFVAPLLGDLQRWVWVGEASLNGVLQKMTQSSDATHESVGSLGAWPSLAVVATYTVAVSQARCGCSAPETPDPAPAYREVRVVGRSDEAGTHRSDRPAGGRGRGRPHGDGRVVERGKHPPGRLAHLPVAAVSVVALVFRRRHPFTSAFACGGALTGWYLLGHHGELLNLPTMVALYHRRADRSTDQHPHRGRRRRLVGTAGLHQHGPLGARGGSPVLEMVWSLIPLAFGEASRARRQLLAHAEAEREQEARRRVEAERVRIAQESSMTSWLTPWPP